MNRSTLAAFAAFAPLEAMIAQADVVCTSEFLSAGYGSRGSYETTCSDGREVPLTPVSDRATALHRVTETLAPQRFRPVGSYFSGEFAVHVLETDGTAQYCLLAKGEEAWMVARRTYLDCSERTIIQIENGYVEQYLMSSGLSPHSPLYAKPKGVYVGTSIMRASLELYSRR